MVAVGGGAVGADAGAAGEAEDVALVLLVGLVRRARHEEALRHQAGNPPGPHPHSRRRRISLPRAAAAASPPGRRNREGPLLVVALVVSVRCDRSGSPGNSACPLSLARWFVCLGWCARVQGGSRGRGGGGGGASSTCGFVL